MWLPCQHHTSPWADDVVIRWVKMQLHTWAAVIPIFSCRRLSCCRIYIRFVLSFFFSFLGWHSGTILINYFLFMIACVDMSMNDQNRLAWERYEQNVGATTRPLPPLPHQQPHRFSQNSEQTRRAPEDVFAHGYDASIDHSNVSHSIPHSTMEMDNDSAETKSLQSQIGALIPTASTNVLREVLKLLTGMFHTPSSVVYLCVVLVC